MVDSPKPHIRFHYSEELHKRTIEVLDALEQAEDPTTYREALGDLVVELTKAGMDYFFVRPLELAEMGFMTRKSAQLGMATTQRVMGPIIRKVIGGMDKDQLLIVCDYMRQLMY